MPFCSLFNRGFNFETALTPTGRGGRELREVVWDVSENLKWLIAHFTHFLSPVCSTNPGETNRWNLCQNCEEWARASYLQVSRTVGGNPNVHHPGIRVGWLEKHFPSDRQEEGSKWHCWCPTASARPWCRFVIQVQSIQGGTSMPSNPPSQLQST